ncbi:LAMI_0C10836g1_1 [Lachancea mirantina]|uniref:Large ribosomal subunit protein mL44 n=1 Tax=Lachancea mirantina TaxID=1230905 RepID=A0A1G4J6P4_9SACH|nr:LAMI_0C10836g1_1 [Lachancea mirantina]
MVRFNAGFVRCSSQFCRVPVNGNIRYLTGRSSCVKEFHASSRQNEASQLSTPEIDKYREYYRNMQAVFNHVPEDVATKSPSLVTLHKRLQLPETFSLSTLARCLTCRSSHLPFHLHDQPRGSGFPNSVPTSALSDNHGLNIFGKNLLTYHVTHQVLLKYPRLPTVVLNAAVDAYISEQVLANVAKSWGIEIEETTVLERYLKGEPVQLSLGRLRYFNNTLKKEDGIEVVRSQNFSDTAAYALAARSIIGALWAHSHTSNKRLAFEFIDQHILSRKLDVSKLFQFEHPTRELSALCRREGLIPPVSKLLAESGRLSKAPVFIVGVFSGDEKIGEGFGSSLKEAKARAATDALMKWYCYQPVEGQANVVDHGAVIV